MQRSHEKISSSWHGPRLSLFGRAVLVFWQWFDTARVIDPCRNILTFLPFLHQQQGDATYLVVKDDGSIENYGINAVCTHLGCVVPWNKAENKFKCPCHGSQYNNEGKVIRGPAPLSLALAHADINESDVVIFSPWTETDFRTGLQPWWK